MPGPMGDTPPKGAAALVSERFAADATLAAVAAGGAALAMGASGDAVKRVQLALLELGYGAGRSGADGAFGPGTTAQVTAFQRAMGLPGTGAVDAASLAALDARVRAADHPAGRVVDANLLDAPRFASDPVLRAVAAGGAPIGRGAPRAAVEKLQLTLVGLGFDLPQHGADGAWGGETEDALRAFQRGVPIPETGALDRVTLLALDDAAARQVQALRGRATAPEEKAVRWKILVDLVGCRIHVVERSGGKHVACYLTSPGVREFPTKGEQFVLQETKVLSWWQPPPDAAWARALRPVPPGLANPMGICKLHFGRYAQYFHGIPKDEEPHLGRLASHGCCRMSGANILEFHQLYAGPGSEVRLGRDAALVAQWSAGKQAAGVVDRPITAGREYTAAYLYGEIGANERLERDGRVTVAGRGGDAS